MLQLPLCGSNHQIHETLSSLPCETYPVHFTLLTTLHFLKLHPSSASLMPHFPGSLVHPLCTHEPPQDAVLSPLLSLFLPRGHFIQHLIVITDSFKSWFPDLTSHRNPTLLFLIMVISTWTSPNTSISVCPIHQPRTPNPNTLSLPLTHLFFL